MDVKAIKKRLNYFKNKCLVKLDAHNINNLMELLAELSGFNSECHSYVIDVRSLYLTAKMGKDKSAAIEMQIFYEESKGIHEMLSKKCSNIVSLLSAHKALLNIEPKTQNYGPA